jgi:hypothetical protein
MSRFEDIVDGTAPDIETRRSGLIYTCRCGWIDLGHARPDNVARLWRTISTESGEGRTGGLWYRVDFTESMGRWGLSASESRSFAVRRGLPTRDKEAVALAILLDVSHRFETMQGSGPWRFATDSGYSAEDLVSNIVGFYRAVRPGIDYISRCDPVSRSAAEAVWRTYGAVGSLKNHFAGPFLFPCAECGVTNGGPMSSSLPPFLSAITAAPEGELFQAWDPKLVWEDPAQPLAITINVHVVQKGEWLSKIAARWYGDMFLWPLIFDANRQLIGQDPNLIRPGQKLVIPDHAAFGAGVLEAARRRGRSRAIQAPPPR